MMEYDKKYMEQAVDLSREGMKKGAGGPFGAVVVKEGHVIAGGFNEVTGRNDPTAHAEMVAIRRACKFLESYQLSECVLYSSCEPCPMCFGAIYWARPEKVFYALRAGDAKEIGFDDSFIYEEIGKVPEDRGIHFEQVEFSGARDIFEEWQKKEDKIAY